MTKHHDHWVENRRSHLPWSVTRWGQKSCTWRCGKWSQSRSEIPKKVVLFNRQFVSSRVAVVQTLMSLRGAFSSEKLLDYSQKNTTFNGLIRYGEVFPSLRVSEWLKSWWICKFYFCDFNCFLRHNRWEAEDANQTLFNYSGGMVAGAPPPSKCRPEMKGNLSESVSSTNNRIYQQLALLLA